MKVLFITPPYSIRERYRLKTDIKRGFLPPLGIGYIAAVLQSYEHKIRILDLPVLNYSMNDLEHAVKEFNPDLLAFSAVTPSIHRAFEIANYLDNLVDVPIVFGGPHVSTFPQQTLEEQGSVDIVVVGEGEYTMRDLVSAIDEGKDLTDVNGIYYRNKSNRIIKTGERDLIRNLDELPFPARDLFDLKRYIPLPNQYNRLPVMNMITSRGCFYRKCSYCFEAGRLGHIYRRQTPQRVIEEIKMLIGKYGVREITFWDDVFVVGKKWIFDFCNAIKEEGIDITWTCYTRVDMISRELLEKMAKAGCWNIFYGIESGDQILLDKIRKGITLDQARRAVKWTKEAGIETRCAFMLALPGETLEMGNKTIDFAIELDPDYAQFALTTPYPGTLLYDQCVNEGTINKDFKRYGSFEPVFIPNGYRDEEQLERLLRKAYRKFYFRLSYILKTLKRIHTFDDLKKYLLGLKFTIGMSY